MADIEQKFLQAVALVILEDRETWDRFLEGEVVKVPSPEDRARQALSTVIDGKCLAIVDLEGEMPEKYKYTSVSYEESGAKVELGTFPISERAREEIAKAGYTHPIVALLGKEKEDERDV